MQETQIKSPVEVQDLTKLELLEQAQQRFDNAVRTLAEEKRIFNKKEIKFEDMQIDDCLAFSTSGDLPFFFQVTKVERERGQRKSVTGDLYLPEKVREVMGTPKMLSDVKMVSAEGMYIGGLLVGHSLDVVVPLKSMGPLLGDREENMSYSLELPVIESVTKKKLKSLPKEMKDYLEEDRGQHAREEISVKRRKLNEVNDWPGKNSGITFEEVSSGLYDLSALHWGGVRGRYLINPDTGAISRRSVEVYEKYGDVWGAVEAHCESLIKGEHQERNSKRIAAFTWWAMRLGLEPPENIVKKINDVGLEFNYTSLADKSDI